MEVSRLFGSIAFVAYARLRLKSGRMAKGGKNSGEKSQWVVPESLFLEI